MPLLILMFTALEVTAIKVDMVWAAPQFRFALTIGGSLHVPLMLASNSVTQQQLPINLLIDDRDKVFLLFLMLFDHTSAPENIVICAAALSVRR